MNDFQNQSLDIGRSALSSTVEMMTATAEGVGRLHAHQLETIKEALAEQSALTAKIGEAKSREELAGMLAALAGIQFKYATAYWSSMNRLAIENQAALQKLGQAQSVEIQRHLATSLEVAGNGGQEPVVEAVKATVTAISAGLSTLARATAESVRLAAAQSSNTEASAQTPNTKAVRSGR